MPKDDYTSTGGGLKLKGTKDAGISKHKKKKVKPSGPWPGPVAGLAYYRAPAPSTESSNVTNDDPARTASQSVGAAGEHPPDQRLQSQEARAGVKDGGVGDKTGSRSPDPTPASASPPASGSAFSAADKTAAELRHEEMRRKRLAERLAREGTKTHKERVEELNRYLSSLSEHHDMPRIGPG